MDKFTFIQQTLSPLFLLPARNTLKPKVLVRFDTAEKAIKCSKIIHLNNRAVFLAAHLATSSLSAVPETFHPHGKAKDSAELSMYITYIMEPHHLHHCSFHRLDREG